MSKLDLKKLTNPFLLAPMAEITHCAFRRLIASFGGCGIQFTEMLGARSLPCINVRTAPQTKRVEGDSPLFYQILAEDPKDMAPAIEALQPLAPDGIDINMGCPAPKVMRKGGGLSLRRDLPRAEQILRETRKAWPGTLTVKTRIGEELDLGNFAEFTRMVSDCGANGLILHPRLKDEKLKRRARWEVLEEIRKSTDLAIIGNGDITSAQDALNRKQQYPVDGVMIGRAAIQMPWIFRDIQAIASDKSTQPVDLYDVWSRFVEYLENDFPAEKRFSRLVQFSEYFSKNLKFNHEFWRKVHASRDFEKAASLGRTLASGP